MLDFMKQKKEELEKDYCAAVKEAENIKTEMTVIENLITEYEEEIAEATSTEATGIYGVPV